MAMNRTSRPFPKLVKRGAVAAAGLMVAGCVNFSALDDLKLATPPAGPFERALFTDYAFLARTFGDVGQASYTAFDQEGSIPLAKTDAAVAELANAYAAKALLLSHGSQVDPEASKDLVSHDLRDRLVRALTQGHDIFPRDAARAQADYDCWLLNATVPSQGHAAAQCRSSLNASLPRLESEVRAATPAPAASPSPAQTPAQPPDSGAEQ